MGIATDVIRVACNTATGTQDITGDVGGLTPKAAIFIVSYATTDGTAADHASFAMGWTDGTRSCCISHSSQHNVNPTDSYHVRENVPIVIIDPTAAGSADGRASFSAWLTDGVRIDWTSACSAAFLLTVVLLAGSDLSAYADVTGSLGNVVDTVNDITAPGFEPTLVIAAFSESSTNFAAQGYSSIGFVHNDGAGGITQKSPSVTYRDNRTTTQNYLTGENGAGFDKYQNANRQWYGDFGSFDSSGFSITTRVGGANNDVCGYLALAFGGAVSTKVIEHNTPTSTGSNSETGVGFKPQLVLMHQNMIDILGTTLLNHQAGTYGVAAIGPSAQFSTTCSDEDNVSTSNSQSLSDNLPVQIPDDNGSALVTASFTSFDTNGWTFDYTAVDTTDAYILFSMCIEEEAGAPADEQPLMLRSTTVPHTRQWHPRVN